MIEVIFVARPLRIEYEGAVYHVTSRGNARQSIFQDGQDSQNFMELLEEVVDRYEWICHAYCLMGNHYHLLLETPQPNLSRGMHHLNCVYTQKFNRRHERVGHLLQGRFKGILVEREGHLLALTRYVVRNPVRAEIVNDPAAWRWSSYRATAGLEPVPPFLHTAWLLSQFGEETKKAVEAYRAYVKRGVDEDPWEDLHGGMFLGSERFVEAMGPLLEPYAEDRDLRIRERFAGRPSLDKLFDGVRDKTDRNGKICDAVCRHGYTLKEVGEFLDLHYSTVSHIVNRVVGSS